MNHYFEDYIKHHVNEEAVELIDWLYNLIGKEALPDDIFDTPPNQAQDIAIHLLTALNTVVWEGVKIEADTKLNNLALTDYAQRQIDEFTPTVKLESGYFEMCNILDNMLETYIEDLVSGAIDMWMNEYKKES